VHDVSAFVAEVANELATWPGVRIDRRSNGAAIVTYEHSELGALYPDRGVAELPVPDREHDVLIEHGDAEPAELTADSVGVSHPIHGPSDITAALELFDRRYRDVAGRRRSVQLRGSGLSPRTAGPALAGAANPPLSEGRCGVCLALGESVAFPMPRRISRWPAPVANSRPSACRMAPPRVERREAGRQAGRGRAGCATGCRV
jgi:hypothetical protein